MTDLTNFLCPMCRQRISTWYRSAANSNTLVNQERWTFIQKHYSKEIRNRIEGKTAQILTEQIEKQKKGIPIDSDVEDKRHKVCSEPGAIRKEYQEYLKREQERIRLEKENEEKKSLELIQKLIQEEERLSMNDYLNLINNTPNPRETANQPGMSNTSTISRQINNLNNHLIERVNSRTDLVTPVLVEQPRTSNQTEPVEPNVPPPVRSKRKHNSSVSSEAQVEETATVVDAPVQSARVKRAQSCRVKHSRQSLNENSVIVVDENDPDVVRRASTLRPRRAKQADRKSVV